jgi:hypothetical protein
MYGPSSHQPYFAPDGSDPPAETLLGTAWAADYSHGGSPWGCPGEPSNHSSAVSETDRFCDRCCNRLHSPAARPPAMSRTRELLSTTTLTRDPILTIDARTVHDAARHLTSPHNRPGERRCRGLRSRSGRGCVWRGFWQIYFWHGPVRWHATTPRRHHSDSPSARSNWHLRCSAVLRRLRVERRGGCHPVCMAMGRRQSKGLAGAVGRASMGYGGRMDSGWRAHLVLATSAGGRPGITTIEWGTVSLPASQPWTALRWARLAVFGRPRRNV